MDAQSRTFRNTRNPYSSLPMQEIQVHILSRLLAACSCQARGECCSRVESAAPGKFSEIEVLANANTRRSFAQQTRSIRI